MSNLQDRHLSASALNLYQSCPLRFRYRYLDNLYWSGLWGASPEDRRAIEKGSTFHLMARRLYTGLEPAKVPDPVEQRELEHWLGLLQSFLPYEPAKRAYYPELELRLNRPNFRLVAKFDLLVVEADGTATIYDWKTERRLPKRSYLSQSAQTLVYRYMLTAAGGAYSPAGKFRPEQVSMVYWNPLYPHRWERLTYTEKQFQLDEAYLMNVLGQIYRTPHANFMATADEKVCARCEYQMLCHGRRAEVVEGADEEWLADLTLTWENLPDLP